MKNRRGQPLCILLLVLFAFATPALEQKITFTVDRNWVPKKDNFQNIQVHLPPGSVSPGDYVVFQLRATTWAGYCMNGYFGDSLDADARNTGEDMTFIRGNQYTSASVSWEDKQSGETERVQTLYAKIGAAPPLSFGLRIECYDYGAVAKLHAVIYNRDATANTVMLPVDDDGNAIADIWQERLFSNGNGWASADTVTGAPIKWKGTATADIESGPDNNASLGDGLTAFEEWRGFLIRGEHRRTHPRDKDIFLYADAELASYGYGWAHQLPPVFQRHRVNPSEMQEFNEKTKNTAINFLGCEGFHRLTQRAIRIEWDYQTVSVGAGQN